MIGISLRGGAVSYVALEVLVSTGMILAMILVVGIMGRWMRRREAWQKASAVVVLGAAPRD